MLSRVADALYWMARYVERAEHAARLIEVQRRLRIDLEGIDPEGGAAQWWQTLTILGLPESTDVESAIVNHGLPGTVASSLARARENARQVREVISSEMWDYLNQAYWGLEEAEKSATKREVLSDALAQVVQASFLWGGVADATMGRGAGWLFIRLGQFVERADKTSRIIATQWRLLDAGRREGAAQPGENLGWLTLLRSCGSLEEYRKRFPTRIDARQIVGFLVLDATYPRTVGYSLSVAATFADRLAALAHGRGERTKRAFGKLGARVEYAELDEVVAAPVVFLDQVSAELHDAARELQRAYFLH